MLVWRLIRQEYAPDLEGEGARLLGGRWNSIGVPVVYCSSSLALAVLEIFVHLPHELRQAGNFPQFQAIALELPDDSVESLKEYNVSQQAAAYGDSFVENKKSLSILVPSVVIRREMNVLLNPHHPRMAEVKVVVQEPFIFDDRLSS